MDPLCAVLAVALPALIAGTLLLLVRRAWAGALAVGLGSIAGVVAIFAPELTGKAGPSLLLVAALATAVGAVPPGRARVALLAALSVAPPLVGLWYLSPDYMARGTKLAWGAGEAVLVFASALSLDAWAGRRDGSGAPLVAWLIAAGGAVAVAYDCSVESGQIAGAVAAALGALAVLAWWKPQAGAVRAAMPVVAAVLAGVWLVAYHMNDFPIAATVLLLAAPLLVWSGELVKKRQALLAGAVVNLPVVAAIVIAVIEAARASSGE